ncbi:hypothetical protein [Thiorhodovibrio litoralis]|uniref:hypothetical protein n=1 Tax=Thiorhodovibrio litoralis TaxID=2952932 RepID=UPI002B25766C|nr:hypothetical protein [Thiorhodovibrio litoralis]WPL12667.1 hypothetical protein Thiosp_02441 [Thiorhodovibrio litoralis]
MDRFLVNMAVVRVNWDKKGSDILDNYIPLVHEALDKISADVFSVDEFKEKFVEIAEFKIPTGAVLSLLKRATNKYQLLEKQPQGIYKIQRDRVKSSGFSNMRDAEQRRYNGLVQKFVDYCKKQHAVEVEEESASTYFFEVLYDIAPLLFANLSEAEKIKAAHSDKNKFLVSKFVAYSNKYDQESFESILSFVRGSMLTETFYYSQNATDITNKPLKKVVVYFDTQFLVRILGFSQRELCIPCEELMEMLSDMDVKTRCFRNTLDELHGIFFAALNQLDQYGRLSPNKPSDVFDFINQNSITPSDLLIIINSLEEKLNERKIFVEEKPEIVEAFSLNENALSERLSSVFEHQSEKARAHDIDCLQAIFQLRGGRKQDYLDRCKAIFITTNAQLARISTLFFNEQYGHSNASLCMGDHVFTSLVWMKSVKKTADLPKDRLVANCYSALLPSDSLWSDYISEVNRLKDKGKINEHDYHVLIHSMAARDQLMDQAFSSDENMFGSVNTILEKAKKIYTEELGARLEHAENEVEYQTKKMDRIIDIVSLAVYRIILFSIIGLWVLLLGYALMYTSPDSISDIRGVDIKSLVFLVLLVVTILNLIFGFKLIDFCKSLARKFGRKTAVRIRNFIDNT